MQSKFFQFILFLFLLMTNMNFSFAQTNGKSKENVSDNFSTLWKNVEKSEKASLPKSAMETVNAIYQKALTEKNSPELIKALIHQMKYESAIDQDQLPERIAEIEKYTNEDTNVTEQSVLYSMLAQLYFKYYQSLGYGINRRTAVTGYIPQDIREWTGNIFMQKVADCVNLSLQHEKELQSTDVLQYAKILTEGNSSRNLRPTLYDFLVYQGINTLTDVLSRNPQQFFEQSKFFTATYFSTVQDFVKVQIAAEPYDFTPQILNLYQRLLRFRLQGNNKTALLLADLDRLDFVYNNTENDDREESYLNALNALEKQYEKEDICVEILYKKALYYQQSGNRFIVPFSDRKNDVNENKAKAYQTCEDGIRKYPKYERINLLINLRNELTLPHANFNSENVVYPGKSLKINISYQNLNSLTVEIYKIKAPVSVYENLWSMNDQYKKNGVLVEKKTIQLINQYPYLNSDTVIEIPMKTMGAYEYVIYSDKEKSQIANQQFSVTRLSSVSRAYDNKYEFLVVDRLSGKPISGAKVNLYRKANNKNRLEATVITDKNGLAIKSYTEKNRYEAYNVSFENDSALILSSAPWEQGYSEVNYATRRLSLFTDRSIYRPGQTVFFKGIAYKLGKNNPEILSNQSYEISLRDSNGKEIALKTFKTNDMGSFSGEFVLPQNLLNGIFLLATSDNSGFRDFRVEEYKRPSFDISFLPVKETYHFGDKIVVKGNANTFSGVNISETKVKYRIIQRQNWFRDWIGGNGNQIAEGFVETNDKGEFQISFLAEKRFRDKDLEKMFYTYEIQASITDAKGETQQSVTIVPVGDISMQLKAMALDGNIEKEKLTEVKIVAYNLNDQEISCKGTYEIYSLKAEQSLGKALNDKDWSRDKLVVSGQFVSGEAIDVKALQIASSGKYRIVMKSQDDKGREILNESDFLLFSASDKQPPVITYEWVLTPKVTCDVGENAEIVYGSSAKEVYVLYEIFKGSERLEINRFELNNNVRKLEIPFKESYGDGVIVNLTFIKDSKFFSENIALQKKKSDPALELKMEVFRDKLLPGQHEEWKLSVKNADKKPEMSEVLVGMYDKSLDKIYANNWYFNPVFHTSLTSPFFLQGNWESQMRSSQIYLSGKYNEVSVFSYDAFNWFGFEPYNKMIMRRMATASIQTRSDSALSEETVMDNSAVFEFKGAPQPSSMAMGNGTAKRNKIKQPDESVQIRQNLNETAFFYPQLKTNSEGETLISFTVPESNTSWKFMALAHTKDLKYGQLIKEAISQKKLMVSPNMPRFIRHGDKMTIATNISNLSDENITGKVSIEFFDPTTEQQNITVANSQKDFSVEAGKTTSASWTFDVPSNIDITACRIIAKSANFSDGEQHLLPVLPNRMMVTESLPIAVSGKGNKNFKLDKLINNKSNTLENYRLTLEFAGNPTWYAVQALPAMAVPVSENVLSWFAAYYANSLATSIANSTPKIKQMIDTWTKQGGTKETLISNLEKNQELKAVLLEETPWVMEAKDETEQKQRLALLFDINRNNNLSASAIAKLEEMQLPDGGWSWFKGMYSSASITQWILYGMGELSELKAVACQDEVVDMQNKAVAFIDKEFVKHYENLKKDNPNWKKTITISTYELEYLFVRGFYKNSTENEGEAIRFYSEIAEKNWTKIPDLYSRAITAIILQRNGKTDVAKAIINSLKEHASHKEDLGMYWANNNTKAFMFQSATAVHTFIMEAFERVGATQKEMDEMKLWLLKQKQTQEWESTPATVNAVSVLLRTGGDWLTNEGKANITLGKQKVDTDTKDAGTGYFKKVYAPASIASDMGNVSVSKQDDGPAWGALYWQYYEQLDKITQAKTNLNVEKLLFVEKVSGSGKTLVPVTENAPLKVGDKVVVRLTVRNDRDMEYVMLKDMRASCFEPVEQLSGTQWKESVVYYQTSKDASTNFYFYNLPKGTYVFEYPVYVTRIGEYSNGITTIQCMYAPEFTSNTAGMKVIVK